MGKVTVDGATSERAPKLLAIYPQTDTVPENLLKFYLYFDQPMRSGQSLNHIALLDQKGDTLQNVFLDLQPELWDSTGTTLTLWLDPGRIKRDLVLNRKYGNPLQKTALYRLVITSNWKDTHGVSLTESYSKSFVAGARDDHFPKVGDWQLTVPKAETKVALLIDAKEALDHYLFEEAVEVLDDKGLVVKGKIRAADKDKQLIFYPTERWKVGNYQLKVNAKLEDLGANNLNRVFDRDLTKDVQLNKLFYYKKFLVK